VGPRAGLDDVEKRKMLLLPGLEHRPPGLLSIFIPSAMTFSCMYVKYAATFRNHKLASAPVVYTSAVSLFFNSVALVREGTIPTERPPLVGEVSSNFCLYRVPRGQRNGSLRPNLGFLDRSSNFFFQVAPQG
jgi:hypothetical protein